MKKLLKPILMSLSIVGLFFLASCDDNEDITPVTPPSEDDVVLELAEGQGSDNVDVDVSNFSGSSQTVRLNFSSTDGNMRRLYITQNVNGQGDEPFELEDLLTNIDTKADGSIDVAAANSEMLEYEFDLPVPPSGTGTVIYTFWATSGRGDYRDTDKRLVVGPGTITMNYGGTNEAADVLAYTAKILAAPLADGSSESFISLLDGQLYQIDQGEEFAAFWDFGYYWGAVGASAGQEASLASTSAYEDAFTDTNSDGIVDVDGIAGTTELNNAFFRKSTSLTSDDFDNIAISNDLETLFSKPSSQVVNNLTAGDIIEFVDNYGKRGLIEVVQVEGTFNQGDFIEINIKVQP